MHPANLLDEEELAILDLWWVYRGNGMALGPLPFTGGWAEQPAWVAPAFQACFAAEGKIEKHMPRKRS